MTTTEHPHQDTGVSPGVVPAWFVLGGVVTAAVLALAAAFAGLLLFDPAGPRSDDQQTVEHDRAAETLSASGNNADITLTGGAETVTSEITRSWQGDEPEVTEQWQGDHLDVALDCAERTFLGVPLDWAHTACELSYAAQLPANASAKLRATSGTLHASRLDGGVDAGSTSGAIIAEDLGGPLTAQTTAGQIRVDGLDGDLRTSSTSGEVNASRLASPRTVAEATAGSIALQHREAPERVQVSTTAGGVEIRLPRGEHYRVETSTSSGTVEVGVVDDPDAQRVIDVSTTSGDITITHAD